jgi:rubrerythrin
MAKNFTADELFEMAKKMEEDGARFYRNAAESVSSEEPRQLLLELADWEDKHRQTFIDMRKQVAGSGGPGLDYDPDGEAADYLRTFVDGRVFRIQSDAGERLKQAEDLNDILRIAVGLEKDAILFYTGMKDVMPSDQEKLKVDKILAEERKHVVTLTRLIETSEEA